MNVWGDCVISLDKNAQLTSNPCSDLWTAVTYNIFEVYKSLKARIYDIQVLIIGWKLMRTLVFVDPSIERKNENKMGQVIAEWMICLLRNGKWQKNVQNTWQYSPIWFRDTHALNEMCWNHQISKISRPQFPSNRLKDRHARVMSQSCSTETRVTLTFENVSVQTITKISKWPSKGFCVKNVRFISFKNVWFFIAYLIFVIFFTRSKFLENKIYTEKRQFFELNL